MPIAAILTLLLFQSPPREVVVHSHNYIPPPPALTVESNLVETSLIVRDSRGKPLSGFHATDFQIFDNGKPEHILSFTESKLPEPGAPPKPSAAPAAPSRAIPKPPGKLITLFFDDLHTESPELFRAIAAARKFLSSPLDPADRIAIATSSTTADLDFTADTAALEAKLDQIRTHTRPPVASCPALQPVEAYFYIKNIDADIKAQAIQEARVCLCGPSQDPSCMNSQATRMAAPGIASSAAETVWGQAEVQSNHAIVALNEAVRRLAAANGARTLVLLSSGFLAPLEHELDPVVDNAMRWNIVIHAIDAKGLDATLDSLDAEGMEKIYAGRTRLTRQTALWEPLERVSDGTGGHFFHNTNDLANAIQMAAEPDISYVVSFNPGGRDGQLHKLKILFNGNQPYSLQFRPGYFSPPDAKKDPSNRAAMDAAVFSRQSLHDIRADVAITPGQASVSVAITVDVNRLEFVANNGRHAQQIVFLVALLDPKGSFITGKEAVMDLALTDEKLASLKHDGLRAVTELNAPAGQYQVRAIVREAMKGSLAASTLPLDLTR